MPMERDTHEALLNELLDPEIETSRKTEILQELRVDYGTVLTDFQNLNESNTKLQKNNDDLVISNSQLFRKLGTIDDNGNKKEEDAQKEFSETVNLTDLEKGLNL